MLDHFRTGSEKSKQIELNERHYHSVTEGYDAAKTHLKEQQHTLCDTRRNTTTRFTTSVVKENEITVLHQGGIYDEVSSDDDEWQQPIDTTNNLALRSPNCKFIDQNERKSSERESHQHSAVSQIPSRSSSKKSKFKKSKSEFRKQYSKRNSDFYKVDIEHEEEPECQNPSESVETDDRFTRKQTFYSAPADARPQNENQRGRSNSSDDSIADRVRIDSLSDSDNNEYMEHRINKKFSKSARVKNKRKLKYSQSTPEVARRRTTKHDSSKFALCEVYGMDSRQKKVKK